MHLPGAAGIDKQAADNRVARQDADTRQRDIDDADGRSDGGLARCDAGGDQRVRLGDAGCANRWLPGGDAVGRQVGVDLRAGGLHGRRRSRDVRRRDDVGLRDRRSADGGLPGRYAIWQDLVILCQIGGFDDRDARRNGICVKRLFFRHRDAGYRWRACGNSVDRQIVRLRDRRVADNRLASEKALRQKHVGL